MDDAESLISATVAAGILKVHRATVYRWHDRKLLFAAEYRNGNPAMPLFKKGHIAQIAEAARQLSGLQPDPHLRVTLQPASLPSLMETSPQSHMIDPSHLSVSDFSQQTERSDIDGRAYRRALDDILRRLGESHAATPLAS